MSDARSRMRWARRTKPWLPLLVILLLHGAATWRFFPASEVFRPEPLRFHDYPVHTYRVEVYRKALRETGRPWAYDPGVAAGAVTMPSNDIGAKPQQVLGVLLPGVPAAVVVRLFLFLAVLTMPLGTLLAGRALGIPPPAQAWVLLALLVPGWLYDNLPRYFIWGLTSFAAASYLASYVVVRFLALLERPRLRTYGLFVLVGSLTLLLHLLGPMPYIPALLACLLVAAGMQWRWWAAIALSPVLIAAVNAFWFVPLLGAVEIPRFAPLASIPAQRPDMTYLAMSDLRDVLSLPRVVSLLAAVALTGYGLVILRSLKGTMTALAFGIAVASTLLLKFFGSFVPFVVQFQPARFVLPAAVLMAIPAGLALWRLVGRIAPAGGAASIAALSVALGATFLAKPEPLPATPYPRDLVDFIVTRTTRADRLLLESRNINEVTQVLATWLDRDVISTAYPELDDPVQFTGGMLWGREISSWSPDELAGALQRWGVSWVLTATDPARSRFELALRMPGELVGEYTAFRVTSEPSRFLVGHGTLTSNIDRLELMDLEPREGLVVLRYRYHPGWRISRGTVDRYTLPEDPRGFIAIHTDVRNVVLSFHPPSGGPRPAPRSVPDTSRATVRASSGHGP